MTPKRSAVPAFCYGCKTYEGQPGPDERPVANVQPRTGIYPWPDGALRCDRCYRLLRETQ